MDITIDKLNEIGAIVRNGHFVLTSGRHTDTYFNKDVIYSEPELVSNIAKEMAKPFRNTQVDIVVGPAIGGVILSHLVAKYLGRMNNKIVKAAYCDKNEDGSFQLRRAYSKLVLYKKVLIVDDIVTTGGSINSVIKATKNSGGKTIGITTICNRSGKESESMFGNLVFKSVLSLPLDTWDKSNCPLCKRNVPLNIDLGKTKI